MINPFTPICNYFLKINAFILKYTIGLFNLWLEHAYKGKNVHNSEVVVVLTAANDCNGALAIPNFLNTYRLHRVKNVKVIYKRISSISDINKKITKIKNRNNSIKGLWLKAHGHFSNILLGDPQEEGLITKDNAHQLTSLKMLEPNATIILDSCSTGHVIEEGNTNIAQSLAEQSAQKIIASTRTVDFFSLQFSWKKHNMHIRFATPHYVSGIKGFFLNGFYLFLYIISLGKIAEDCTAIFKKYQTIR